jgi:hypothetical protein
LKEKITRGMRRRRDTEEEEERGREEEEGEEYLFTFLFILLRLLVAQEWHKYNPLVTFPPLFSSSPLHLPSFSSFLLPLAFLQSFPLLKILQLGLQDILNLVPCKEILFHPQTFPLPPSFSFISSLPFLVFFYHAKKSTSIILQTNCPSQL